MLIGKYFLYLIMKYAFTLGFYYNSIYSRERKTNICFTKGFIPSRLFGLDLLCEPLIHYLFFFFKIYFIYMSTLWLSDRPEKGIGSHYRWLCATMWLLGIKFGTSGRAVSALNCWAISPAPSSLPFLKILFKVIYECGFYMWAQCPQKRWLWGWGFSSVVECLPRKHKALGLVLSSGRKKKRGDYKGVGNSA